MSKSRASSGASRRKVARPKAKEKVVEAAQRPLEVVIGGGKNPRVANVWRIDEEASGVVLKLGWVDRRELTETDRSWFEAVYADHVATAYLPQAVLDDLAATLGRYALVKGLISTETVVAVEAAKAAE